MVKKALLIVVLSLSIMFCGVLSVSAMSENDLMTKIKTPVEVNNGSSLTVPQYYINLAEDYFDQFDVSSKDCDYIAKEMDKLIKLAKKDNITSWEEFGNKYTDEIKKACANVSANTGIKVTVLSNGKVSVSKYNNPNEVFAIVNAHLLKNTGSANILYIAGIITLLGAGIFVTKVKKA